MTLLQDAILIKYREQTHKFNISYEKQKRCWNNLFNNKIIWNQKDSNIMLKNSFMKYRAVISISYTYIYL